MKVIVYEANEIPWRVAAAFVQKKPRSTLARLLRNAHTYTTHTKDSGELHPWTTWPTLHRGVYNDVHNIRFINQDLPRDWPPLWEILEGAGIRTGVFGSLQSYPIPHGDYAFFVPDTFARGPETHPRKYEAFQRFNLRQTKKDGAGATKVILSSEVAADAWRLVRTGLRPKTALRLAKHLIRERADKTYRSRRPVMQAPVAFDFFLDAFRAHQPDFATFFTNHVAGVMHRYWKYSFPEDFEYQVSGSKDAIYKKNLDYAMAIVDEQLTVLKDIADKTNALLLVCSSMGQEAVVRPEYNGEFRIHDEEAFCRYIGFTGPCSMNLAMQPDFSFEFENEGDRKAFRKATERVITKSGDPLFTYKETDRSLNLNLKAPKDCLEKEIVFVRFDDGAVREVAINQMGIDKLWRDEGTGYHQPRGMALFYRKDLPKHDARTVVESIQIAPTLLSMFGVDRPSYMAPPLHNLLSAVGIETPHRASPEKDRRARVSAS